MTIRRALLSFAASALIVANVACHDITPILMEDNRFDPRTAVVALAGDAVWGNQGENNHTTTSKQGFWDSGSLAPAGDFSHQFHEAGSYAYRCTFHKRMTGTIQVPTLASPPEGDTTTEFTITWATFDMADGEPGPYSIPPTYNMDVQIKKPGSTEYRSFLKDQTGTQTETTFTPPKKGVYKFRARLQNTDTGEATGYSPAARIEVTNA